jgi:hypothetical protein
MKLSLIHNQYKKNPYTNESVRLGLRALRDVNIDYEYVIFNDNGDKEIYEDIKEFLDDPKVKYVYSDVNYGLKLCSGGWVGAQPHLTGELIHNMGQDDIFSPVFYEVGVRELTNDPDLMLIHFNAFAVNEKLEPKSIMLHPDHIPDYYNHPFELWKSWFGVGENGHDEVTRANNNFLAPGVIYKKKLHDLIGLPDINNFVGACDFEFWARVLFYGYKCKQIAYPTWLYRQSELSTSVGQDDKIKIWVDNVKKKYYNLYKEIKNSKTP